VPRSPVSVIQVSRAARRRVRASRCSGCVDLREVVDLVRIGLRVEKLLAGAVVLHESERRAGEFAFGVQLAHERLDGEALFFVAVQRGKGGAGGEGADVVKALVMHAADALHGLVNAVAGGEGEAAWCLRVIAEEDAALHQRRTRDACEG
jgi:hypothetical protein